MGNKLGLAAVIAAVAFGAAACGSDDGAAAPAGQGSGPATVATQQGGSPSAPALVGPEDFAAAVAEPGVVVLDVRTPEEFASGHLTGAVNIDAQDPGFAGAVAELDPHATYAVYCRSGNRSAAAVAHLADQGFTSLVELDGGIVAWEAAGNAVTTS